MDWRNGVLVFWRTIIGVIYERVETVLFYSYCIHSYQSMTEPNSPPPPGEPVKVAER
jgi:hypothetical protein